LAKPADGLQYADNGQYRNTQTESIIRSRIQRTPQNPIVDVTEVTQKTLLANRMLRYCIT